MIPFISPELLCALQPGIRSVSTGVENGLKQSLRLSVQSLHAPSSLVCNAAEPDNSSEDELTFDENIPLTGYKEQEEAIGDVESVSSQTSRPNSGSKKKAGRRPTWKEDDVTDLVDIVCNSEYF